ncbi:hypothetical protein GFS31_32800 [Leptolyngbya sp. BL0902]|nr:hypothetical protein GFS31_32800 [Leptolyngbya sp. BL0902]
MVKRLPFLSQQRPSGESWAGASGDDGSAWGQIQIFAKTILSGVTMTCYVM